MAATEQFVPVDELAPQEVQEQAPAEQVSEQSAPFDPSAFTDEQIAAIVADQRAQALIDQKAESEASRRFEVARQRALEAQERARKQQEEATRRQWILQGDPDEVRDKLYEEQRQAVTQQEYQARAEASVRSASVPQIQAYFADLSPEQKNQLAQLSNQVLAGSMTEDTLWAQALQMRDATVKARWEQERAAQEEEERKLRAVEAKADAVTAQRPRPDLGGSRGSGNSSITNLNEARAAHRRGDISSAEMRQYQAAFRD